MVKRKRPVEPGFIEIEDEYGNRVVVTEAHWRRWPQLASVFRPVAGSKETTEVVVEPPTGDNEKE